jgi:hypothetical protein
MSDTPLKSPLDGGDFPELERAVVGDLEQEILAIVIEALNQQGFPGLDSESICRDPAHRAAALDMLADCRPLPVVRALMRKIEQNRL